MRTWLSQVAAVTAINLRTLPERRGSSLVAIVGIAGVVAVLLTVLSIEAGLDRVMRTTGSADTVVVLQAGDDSEIASNLDLDQTRLIADAPGLRRGPRGPLASAELFVVVDLPKRSTGTDAHVPLRGVQPAAFAVRDDFEIVEGRGFEPGRHELVVGRAAATRFQGLHVGAVQRWGKVDWTVVGIFSTGGSVAESELWCDVNLLLPAYRRTEFQSVRARLASPETYQQFKDALTRDARLGVTVMRERDFYAGQTETLTAGLRTLAGVVAILMGICAAFGALNTMYTAVASRAREIATLRALGFGTAPTIVSVLAESLVLALVGGTLGGALAYLGFHGYEATTLNWQTYTQVAFEFRVTPGLLARGVFYALGIGLIGGLFPAQRAARLPLAVALRDA